MQSDSTALSQTRTTQGRAIAPLAGNPEPSAKLRFGTAPPRFKHFIELDGLRGIATMAVFFHHVCFTSVQPQGWNSFVLGLRTLSIPGNKGVDLFFVLSGFLITSLLIEARKHASYYHDFYWKRALRILPLYALVLLGVLLFIPGSGRYVLISALFVSNFALFFHVASSGPFWTLAIEEQFYLLWPTVLRRRAIPQLRRWALVLALSSVVLRLAAAAIGHHTYYYTFFRCDGLAAGAFIAFWFYERTRSPIDRARENRTLAILSLAALALLAPEVVPWLHQRIPAFLDAFVQTGTTLLCATTVTFAIIHAGQKKLAILRFPLLTFFGLISYALYMVHLYVMTAYDHLRGPLPPGDTSAYLLRFATVLTVTIIFCLISRYLVELPANSLRRFVLAPKPDLSAAPRSS